VFLPDELIKGSFDIFIRDSEYEKGIIDINALLETIQNTFIENKDIDDLIEDFGELSDSFGKSVKSGIHASSSLSKAFKDGNKVENVPEELTDYKDFIRGTDNYKWIKWLIEGMVYLDMSDNCPYCITDIKNKKSKIAKVKDYYDPKAIEYLNKIVSVFSRLDKYFSESTKQEISKFVKNVNGYTDSQVDFLLEIKGQIDRLRNIFLGAKSINFRALKDVDKIIDMLNNQKIDLGLFMHLNSNATEQKAKIINGSIDSILKTAGELQGKVNMQKRHIEIIIKENSDAINNFLKNSGFNYHVEIQEDVKNQYALKLIHDDLSDAVTDVKNHLSFGEKNAFAVVLFMYDALKSNANLIVLDDPISSFDKNKKYAIIDMLFSSGTKSLRGKTVLLLTHDFEPIIDMVRHHYDRFDKPVVHFLENQHGQLIEKNIKYENIKTFVEICWENLAKNLNLITKMVYLRRYYEILDEKGNGYQLLSNIFHKRDIPLLSTEDREMTDEEIQEGIKIISGEIQIFDFDEAKEQINNDTNIKNLYRTTQSNYEKLHLFRVLFEGKSKPIKSKIILKFINEAFHIENDYIYQLNPCEYQTVPQYVIDECDNQLYNYNQEG
jgi:energy-coupling factor transporter ATP-binding protein EcfA2